MSGGLLILVSRDQIEYQYIISLTHHESNNHDP